MGFSRPLPTVVVAGLLLGSASWAAANLTGPPTGVSGAQVAPAEKTCFQSDCHTGNGVNNGLGSVSLRGLPEKYVPGTTYALALELGSTSTAGFPNRRWGFQITSIRLDSGTRAGTWTPLGNQILNPNPVKQRDYLSHRQAGVQQGASSPVTFELTWTAPDVEEGPIGFFFAGNAANGTGTNLGDFIYSGSDTTFPDGVAVEPVTWGGMKRTGWGIRHR